MAVRCGEPKRQRWGCDQRETSRGTRADMSILGHQGLQPSSRLPPSTSTMIGPRRVGPQGQKDLVKVGWPSHDCRSGFQLGQGPSKPHQRQVLISPGGDCSLTHPT